MAKREYKDCTTELNKIIDVWECLGGGREYSTSDIQEWLRFDMKPAMDSARKLLGRDIPK